MPEGLDKLAGGVGKAIETVPDLYDDALKPATQESGKTLALIPRAINAALVPLRQWVADREYKLAETEKLLAKKLENVDPDKIVKPEAYVAVPAIQAISYSMDSKELRNLFANLLAKAMNSDTKDYVHPSFVEIIKQMSPIDANIFEQIMKTSNRPLITINIEYENDGYDSFCEYCSWIKDYSLNQCRTSFNNLTRLGLIEIPALEAYTKDDEYLCVKQNPLFIEEEKECLSKLQNGEQISYEEHYIKTNELSNLFYRTCVKNL